MTKTTKTKIAIVDTHNLVRHALSVFINDRSDRFVVTLQFATSFDFIKALRASKPEDLPRIVIIDVYTTPMDVFETTSWLKKHHSEIKVLAVAALSDETTIIRLIQAGISGYLPKNTGVDEFFDALSTVSDGDMYFEATDISTTFPAEARNQVHKIWCALSETERQYVRYCVSDLEDKAVLDKIGIRSYATGSFAKKIYAKFGVKTRVGLVIMAVRNRLISLEEG